MAQNSLPSYSYDYAVLELAGELSPASSHWWANGMLKNLYCKTRFDSDTNVSILFKIIKNKIGSDLTIAIT